MKVVTREASTEASEQSLKPDKIRLLVELLASSGHVLKHLAGGERDAVSLLVLLHDVDHFGCAHPVDKSERAAAHRREAEAENGADVSLQRSLEDAVLQAHHGLVDEPDDQALLDVQVSRSVGDGDQRMALEDVGGAGVERPFALLLGVDVTTFAGFPTHHSGRNEILQDLGISSSEPGKEGCKLTQLSVKDQQRATIPSKSVISRLINKTHLF